MDLTDSEYLPVLFEVCSIPGNRVSCVEAFPGKSPSTSATISSSGTRPASSAQPKPYSTEKVEDEETEAEEVMSKYGASSLPSIDHNLPDFQSRYLIGFHSGSASLVTVNVSNENGQKFPIVGLTASQSRILSDAPIKLAVLDEEQDLMLISTIPRGETDNLICINGELQVLWKHKVSEIAFQCFEKGFHSFPFLSSNLDEDDEDTGSMLSGVSSDRIQSDEGVDCQITHIKYDNRHCCAIIGTSWGSIIALSYKESRRKSSAESNSSGVKAYQAQHLYDVLEIQEEAPVNLITPLSRPESSKSSITKGSMGSFGRQSSSSASASSRKKTVKVRISESLGNPLARLHVCD